MKPFGSILEFTKERNEDLMRAYRHQINLTPHIHMKDVAAAVVNMPAARFWVSEERAAIVISALMAGRELPHNMRSPKREMFHEIYRRVLDLRKAKPDTPLFDLVCEVVNSPAPKFYLRPRAAVFIIYNIKKGYYDQAFAKNPIFR